MQTIISGHWPGTAAELCSLRSSRQLVVQHLAQPACRSGWCKTALHGKVQAALLLPSAKQNGSRLQLSCTLV